jgi:metal-sulfur cluster biosynthetic enzyme
MLAETILDGACSPTAAENAGETVAPLWAALHEVEDPEFPMSIVDMGLVIDLQKVGQTVKVKMTFTAMGCPCIDMIMEDVRARLRQEPGVEQVEIEVIWSPPWNKQHMTEQGREIMLLSGVTV